LFFSLIKLIYNYKKKVKREVQSEKLVPTRINKILKKRELLVKKTIFFKNLKDTYRMLWIKKQMSEFILKGINGFIDVMLKCRQYIISWNYKWRNGKYFHWKGKENHLRWCKKNKTRLSRATLYRARGVKLYLFLFGFEYKCEKEQRLHLLF
jgi:hypothetical protein